MVETYDFLGILIPILRSLLSLDSGFSKSRVVQPEAQFPHNPQLAQIHERRDAPAEVPPAASVPRCGAQNAQRAGETPLVLRVVQA